MVVFYALEGCLFQVNLSYRMLAEQLVVWICNKIGGKNGIAMEFDSFNQSSQSNMFVCLFVS